MVVTFYLIFWISFIHQSTMEQSCPKVEFCICELDITPQLYYYDCHGISEIPSYFPNDTYGLMLRHNEIEFLPDTIFDGFVELVDIDLGGNQIKALPADILDPIAKLTYLDLRDNLIKVIPDDIFKTNTKLDYLDLSYNLIEILPNGVFYWNIEMRTLLLSGNKIKVLPVGIFKTNTELIALQLDENPIETFYEGIFNGIELISLFISFSCVCMEKSIYILIQERLKFSYYKVNCMGSSESLWTYQVQVCPDTELLTLYNDNISLNSNECACREKTSVVDPMYSTSFFGMTPSLQKHETTDYDFFKFEQKTSVGILKSTKSRLFITPYVATGLAVGSLCGAVTIITVFVSIVRKITHLEKLKIETKNVGKCEEENKTNYCIENELSLWYEHNTLKDFPENTRKIRSLNIPPINHVTEL